MKLATLRDGSRDGRLLVVRRDGEVAVPSPDVVADAAARARRLGGRGAGAARARRPSSTPATARRHAGRSAAARRAAAARVRVGRRLRVPQPRHPGPQGARGRAAADARDRSAGLPGRLRRPARARAIRSSCTIRRGASTSSPRSASSSATSPLGTTRRRRRQRYVRLVMLANDCTLRNLIPDELAKGFGFFQSKPATAFAPFAVTPDELGDAWRGGRAPPARALDLQRRRSSATATPAPRCTSRSST